LTKTEHSIGNLVTAVLLEDIIIMLDRIVGWILT
jgi:hypothetical protein